MTGQKRICKFCQDLELALASNNSSDPKIFFTYKVALVQQMRREGPASEIPLNQSFGRCRKLTFCPECGTHINWSALSGRKW